MTDVVMLQGGYQHYITSDGKRSFVGPVRHRLSRKVSKARSAGRLVLCNVSRRYREAQVANSNDQTQEITVVPGRPQTLAEVGNQLSKMFAPVLAGMQPPQPPKRNLLQRLRDKLYDEEWHRAARQTAGTVLMWSFTLASVLVFGKGLLWILSL
jgi:hypothetical protein